MNMSFKKSSFNKGLLMFVVVCSFLPSCVSKKTITYFNKDLVDQTKVSNFYKTVYKPDDLLKISISSIDMEAVMPFNFNSSNSTEVSSNNQQTYLIDSKGEIDFPILGKLKIGGLGREDAINLFKVRLDPAYVKSPSININIINYKVSVLGAVGSPGSYTIPNERLTIIEALSMAGDLALTGERENILVIREEDNQKNKYIIDLTSNTVFTSPVYYLQQNDVVYVEQNYASMQAASRNSNTSFVTGLVGVIVAVGSLLIRF